MYIHRVSCFRTILVSEGCVDSFVCGSLHDHYLFDFFLDLIISEECLFKAESHCDS
jgi:hypothetical protein